MYIDNMQFFIQMLHAKKLHEQNSSKTDSYKTKS